MKVCISNHYPILLELGRSDQKSSPPLRYSPRWHDDENYFIPYNIEFCSPLIE